MEEVWRRKSRVEMSIMAGKGHEGKANGKNKRIKVEKDLTEL